MGAHVEDPAVSSIQSDGLGVLPHHCLQSMAPERAKAVLGTARLCHAGRAGMKVGFVAFSCKQEGGLCGLPPVAVFPNAKPDVAPSVVGGNGPVA